MQIDLETEQPDKSSMPLIGILLLLLPGLLILLIELSTKLGHSNAFLLVFLLFLGGIIGLIGLIIYLVAERGLKKKTLTILASITFYALLLPVIWGVNSLKERIYIYIHGEILENVATDLLKKAIQIEEANEILRSKNLVLKVTCVPNENEHVLFLIEGLIDNCYGFSYSLTDRKPSENCCGDLISWKKIKKKWYKWGTT